MAPNASMGKFPPPDDRARATSPQEPNSPPDVRRLYPRMRLPSRLLPQLQS